MPLISDVGETELAQKIKKWCVPSSHNKKASPLKVKVPLGDDAYVVNLATPMDLAVTTDTLIEGTHFNLGWLRRFLTPRECWRFLGYKAIAVNLSDLAAMGNVKPLFALTTLGLNGDISVDTVDNIFRGIRKLTKSHGFSIVGGDIIRSDKSIISITIVGKMLPPKPIPRSGARVGDVLMVTGPLGLSSAGMEILKTHEKSRVSYRRILLNSHLYPKPKLKEGAILSNVDIMATSLMDTSDDLVTSVEILSQNSHVGFEMDLENVPLHPALTKYVQTKGVSPYGYILYGGEDYQLLFTVPPSKVDRVLKKIPPAYVLGTVRQKSFGIKVKTGGKTLRVQDRRFRHF